MIVTLVSACVIVWAGVAIGAAIAIGRAMRLADDAMRHVSDYAQNPDRRPLHPSQMLFVQDILDAAVQS